MLLALLVALIAVTLVRGVAPAISRLDSDFPSYLTAAVIVANHGDVARLYDNAWFEAQMRRYRIGRPWEGKFAPQPPPMALLMLPLARLDPLAALRVMTAFSVLCLAGSILLLARVLRRSLVETAVFVLLSGWAICNGLRLGQPYILVSGCCILGYYARSRGRALLSGACFGLFTPFKYFPVVLLGYFATRREWRLVLGGAIAIGAVALISIAVLGWKLHQEFLTSVLGNHLIARLGMQNPYTASFQSFDSLFRRLFVFDAADNPRPWLAQPALQVVCLVLTKALLLGATLGALLRLRRRDPADAVAPSVGLVGVLTLLLAPATATYHFVLLWLPVGLLIDYLWREGGRIFAYGVLAAYALIGFCPYGWTARFEGHDGLTVLAYPRLWLLLAMLAVALCFVYGRAPAKPLTSPHM